MAELNPKVLAENT